MVQKKFMGTNLELSEKKEEKHLVRFTGNICIKKTETPNAIL